MTEFEIDRREWRQGELGDVSRLIAQDGKKCCLGFFGLAIGIPANLMLGVPSPAMARYLYHPAAPAVSKFQEAGLITEGGGNTEVCSLLMNVNDLSLGGTFQRGKEGILTSEADRERIITEAFAEIGYKPIFTN